MRIFPSLEWSGEGFLLDRIIMDELKEFGAILSGKTSCEEDLYRLVPFNGEEIIGPEFDEGYDRWVIRILDDEHWIKWYLFECCQRGITDGSEEYIIYMCGEGPGGEDVLREPRHTWFGKDGYIFYVKPNLIAWCFEKLKKYFDY